jgi:hypothetical protein
MGKVLGFYGILQRCGDMFLPHNRIKGLWPVLSR